MAEIGIRATFPREFAGLNPDHSLYVQGEFSRPSGTSKTDVINPTTEELITKVSDAGPKDVDRAASAAAAAFSEWSETPLEDRLQHLSKLAALMRDDREALIELQSTEMGSPVSFCGPFLTDLAISLVESTIEVARFYPYEEKIGDALVVREPFGVVGTISPWNNPMVLMLDKVAPALAAGCPVVAKPANLTTMTGLAIATLIDRAGFPPGVFNLVAGPGGSIGDAISGHPEIDFVAFTGSLGAGGKVMESGAKNAKRVQLELGGKSAAVLLDDCDLVGQVQYGVRECMANAGQLCDISTRLLVPRERIAELTDVAVETAKALKIGDPLDPETDLGPMVSAKQRETVRGYIRSGVEQGARLATGGDGPPAGFDRGWYVQPTIFSDVDNGMKIAQEEIFGPVLCIIPYDDQDDAVRIANDSVYGLCGRVESGSRERAEAVARRIRTGSVYINGGQIGLDAPFGGYKQSGFGRAFGRYGFSEYLQVKTLQFVGQRGGVEIGDGR